MFEYHLNVGQEEGNKNALIVIQSSKAIPDNLLQIAGLMMDGGFSPTYTDEMHPTAAAYVSVKQERILPAHV